MKMFILIVSMFTVSTFAATLEIIGPCEEAPLFSGKIELANNKVSTVGKVTIDALDKNKIPYLGSHEGINSIYDTPVGIDAYEILNDEDMNAYGWCYSVNGVSPELYPHEVSVKAGDKIVWWFGYAQYVNGQWLTQCLPSYLRKAPQFCQAHEVHGKGN
jgi:hypothetical protein